MTIILIFINLRCMYVCICQAITEKQVAAAVNNGADTVEALRDQLGVASCCGTCAPTAEEVIAQTRAASKAQPKRYIPAANPA
ncbi:MAG: (2Fe-2S)-binding protein [Pseudomonadota bacterium]